MTYRDEPAIKQVILVSAQWSDMPEEVVEEVRNLWRNCQYGNDNYYYNWINEDWLAAEGDEDYESYIGSYPKIARYLRDNGLSEKDHILINYWW